MNYALALPANHIRGTPVDMSRLDLRSKDTSREAVLNEPIGLLNESVAPETREAILSRFSARQLASSDDLNVQTEASALTALLLASPDFQRRLWACEESES